MHAPQGAWIRKGGGWIMFSFILGILSLFKGGGWEKISRLVLREFILLMDEF